MNKRLLSYGVLMIALAVLASAGSLSYQYDADGRLVLTTKDADFSNLSVTPVHNFWLIRRICGLISAQEAHPLYETGQF